MNKANQRVRRAAGANGLNLWEVAEAMNILDCNLSRKLRRELPEEEQNKIIAVIERTAAERDRCHG